jgi:hypothetical protein
MEADPSTSSVRGRAAACNDVKKDAASQLQNGTRLRGLKYP